MIAITDEQTIRAIPARWLTATRECDVAAIAALMHPDILFFTVGGPPFGREFFLEAFRAMQGQISIEGTAEVRDLTIDNDHAYAQVFLDITISHTNKPSMHKCGPVLSIYKRTNGQWQLYRDANFVA